MSKRNGFTLLELLLTIAIAGIIIAVSLATFPGIIAKSRDGRRKSDFSLIASALEQFYSTNNAYPDEALNDRITCNTDATPHSSQTIIAWGGRFVCNNITYLNKLPVESRVSSGQLKYLYEVYEVPRHPGDPPGWCTIDGVGGNCRQYTLWAELENSRDSDIQRSSNDPICNAAKIDLTTDGTVLSGHSNLYCIHGP